LSFYDSTGTRGFDLTKPYSEKTAELIDREVKELIQMIHDKTLKILTDNKEGFLALATILLEKEVIFAEDLENIFGPRVGAKAESTVTADVQDPAEPTESETVSEEVAEE
jgi:cell division protease FtsH